MVGSRSIRRWAPAVCLLVIAHGAVSARAQQSSDALPDLANRLATAREATKTYAHKLRGELQQALRTIGPKAAIGLCTTLAPDLNNAVSEESNFEVGRTALRLRNPENAPDEWERATLEAFARQIAAGTDPHAIEAHTITQTREGQKLFRYMRPIMMHETCLACHGPNVANDVKAEIARSYADDKAIGFNVGELRGAFTLFQQID